MNSVFVLKREAVILKEKKTHLFSRIVCTSGQRCEAGGQSEKELAEYATHSGARQDVEVRTDGGELRTARCTLEHGADGRAEDGRGKAAQHLTRHVLLEHRELLTGGRLLAH